MQQHVSTVSKGGYECPICPDGGVFARQMGLRNHILKEHVSMPRRVSVVYTTAGLTNVTSALSPSPILRPTLTTPSSNTSQQISPSLRPLPPSSYNLPTEIQLGAGTMAALSATPMTPNTHDEASSASEHHPDDMSKSDDCESSASSTQDSPIAPMTIAHQLLAVAQQHHAAEVNNTTGLSNIIIIEEDAAPELHLCPKEDCSETSEDFQVLLKHMIYAHSETDSDRPYVCPYPACNKSYPGQG